MNRVQKSLAFDLPYGPPGFPFTSRRMLSSAALQSCRLRCEARGQPARRLARTIGVDLSHLNASTGMNACEMCFAGVLSPNPIVGA
ncbi:MAG: hypothetical protein ACYDCT_06930, partial [Dehalococcoidia bacterium]